MQTELRLPTGDIPTKRLSTRQPIRAEFPIINTKRRIQALGRAIRQAQAFRAITDGTISVRSIKREMFPMSTRFTMMQEFRAERFTAELR